jgi:NAD(P)-dependent dehydrogenase (short-subunit alcohol dehydrogenase family)
MTKNKTALIIGASRGLGLGLAQEFLKRGWGVVGTVRGGKKTELHNLAAQSKGMLEIASIDITDVSQIAALKSRLAGKKFDLLFVNSGVANDRNETIGEISTEEFVRVFTTNTLSAMRVVEELSERVTPQGTIGVMSSGLGSVTNNEGGGFEVYRASKAALNTLMRSFAARAAKDRTLLLIAPGWVKTDMGGPEATFSIEEVMPQIVDTITAQEGKKGLQYLDRFGKPISW